MLPERRVFCHPTPSCRASSPGPKPLCTVHRKKIGMLFQTAPPSPGQVPSPLPPEAGQESLRPDRPRVRGVGPPVAPTPRPRMKVPALCPTGPRPCPSRRQPCSGGAGEWSRKGTPESSESEAAAAAAVG